MSFKKTVIFFLSFSTTGILFALAGRNFVRKIKYLKIYFPYLIHTNIEDRKINSYGNCNNFGYGYLKKIVDKLPDANIFPDARYKDYQKFVFLLFPGYRNKIDTRLKAGIDLDKEDIRETLITTAVLEKREITKKKELNRWTFQTVNDYDLLTGFRIYFEKPFLSPEQNISINLIHSVNDNRSLGNWAFKSIINQKVLTYHLPKPIPNFSFSRGATDFILEIENISKDNTALQKINKIEILGVKVDLSGYTIINREQKCLTAVKTSFLKKVKKEGPESWRKYFREITNVRSN